MGRWSFAQKHRLVRAVPARRWLFGLMLCGVVAAPAVMHAPHATGQGSLWSIAEPMLVPRSEMSVATLGDLMYVIGGYPAGRIPSDIVQVYDGSTDRWSFGPSLPVPLHHTMAVAVNDTVYVIGGEFEGAGTSRPEQYVNSVYMLDRVSNTWVARAPMPTERSGGGAAVIDGKVYVAGGRPPHGRDFAVYDPVADSWQVLAEVPTARNHLGMAAIGGRLYVAGGRFGAGVGSEMTAVLEIFDPATGEWTAGPPLPAPRAGVTAIAVHDCLYVIGGEGNDAVTSGVFEENEAFDPRRGTWQRLTSMATPTHGLTGAGWLNGRIHIPGGAVTRGGNTGVVLHQTYLPELDCR